MIHCSARASSVRTPESSDTTMYASSAVPLAAAFGVGAHGVWGGLVEEERRAVRGRWLAGTLSANSSRTSPHG